MNRAFTLVAFAALGCGNEHGVALEVTGPADVGIDRVELLIAPSECRTPTNTPCDRGIAWDTTDAKQSGPIFLINSDTVLDAAIDSDGFARFRIEPEGTLANVQRIVAIGYKAGTAVGVATIEGASIPQHRAEIWQLPLETLPDIARDDKHQVDAMHAWHRADPKLSTCAVIERVHNGSGSFEFFVPPGDTDCDDEIPECDPFWAHYKPSSTNANCLTMGPLNPLACTLGNTSCADGVGPGTCSQSNPETCLPDVFCGCNPLDSPCLTSTFTDLAGPYFQCLFPASSGASCPSLMNNAAVFDLDQSILPPASCDALQFLPFQAPIPKPIDPLVFSGLTFNATKRTELGKRCNFALTWQAGTFTLSPGPATAGFFDITLHTGKHILIPYNLSFIDQTMCPLVPTSMTICSFHQPPSGGAADHVFDCAKLN